MKIIIDTNIILSALIKDSITRKLIVELEHDLYYPELSFHELRKYKNHVIEKSGMSVDEYEQCFSILMKRINLISEEQIKSFLDKAAELIAHRDPNDVVFLASALSFQEAVIWSEDKDFESQDFVPVIKTKDMLKIYFDEDHVYLQKYREEKKSGTLTSGDKLRKELGSVKIDKRGRVYK